MRRLLQGLAICAAAVPFAFLSDFAGNAGFQGGHIAAGLVALVFGGVGVLAVVSS